MILWLAGLGASIGAVLRYAVTNFVKRIWKYNWPLPTLLINLSGALILGFVFGMKVLPTTYALVGTGILGGYTTFSTMNVELLGLMHKWNSKSFWTYFLLSYAGGLILVFAGFYLGRMF